jgi:PmbA protein
LSGKLVASKAFTLIDDGRMADGLYSTPFDDEGSPTGRALIFDNGVLKTLLYNAYAARKDNASPTGNGRRGSFRGVPATAPTNLYVKPGTLSAARIIEGVGDGLLVLGLQGMHAGVSAVSGQFSAGAYGIRIRGGRLAEPVREITIASTCADILKNVGAVGADIRFMPMGANIGSPSVVVEGMVISGR